MIIDKGTGQNLCLYPHWIAVCACFKNDLTHSDAISTKILLTLSSDSLMHTLANSEDQDEMPHNAAFHQVYTVISNTIFRKRIILFIEIITCDPLIYMYIQWTIPSSV